MSEWLSLEQAAKRACVSVSTIRHWIRVRNLPSRRPGRRRLIDLATLDRFIDQDGDLDVVPVPATTTPLAKPRTRTRKSAERSDV